jgi:hypothetical protein
MTRRSEHDPVASRLAEPGVGGAIAPSDVRLELDDPADASPGRVVTNESGADERSRGVDRRGGEDRPIDDRQPRG